MEAIRGNTIRTNPIRTNLGHARDALLMDTARAENATFVTCDERLRHRGERLGLDVWSWRRLRNHLLGRADTQEP